MLIHLRQFIRPTSSNERLGTAHQAGKQPDKLEAALHLGTTWGTSAGANEASGGLPRPREARAPGSLQICTKEGLKPLLAPRVSMHLLKVQPTLEKETHLRDLRNSPLYPKVIYQIRC